MTTLYNIKSMDNELLTVQYIKREEALMKLMQDGCSAKNLQSISDMPAADVAPVRHGRWVDAYPDIEPNPMFMYGICSECGFEQGLSKYLKYCPDCGAKMDEKEDKHEDYT